MLSPGSTVATDEQLVTAAREGSDEAFEALFRRYRDRITTHVRGMVYDRGRAEDIVQETFISALRNLRASGQEIAFKPWIYQIARNACIDHLRRMKRSEELSIDQSGLEPGIESRLALNEPPTEITVLKRQELDDLQQAFGGLPASQHEILLLREFEGLSYQEIGRRMSLTPAAVESMLSRARRTLKGQYDEISTGERCRRMRPVMVAVSHGLAGKRDRRTLERHVRHCRSCRDEASALGLDSVLAGAARSPVRGALSRVAGLFPLPWLFRRRPDEAGEGGGAGMSAGAHAQLTHLSAIGGAGAEQTASALQKAVALVAVAAVAGGGGIVAHRAGVGLPIIDRSSPAKSEAAGDSLTPKEAAAFEGIGAGAQPKKGAARHNAAATPASGLGPAGGGPGSSPAALLNGAVPGSGPASGSQGSADPVGGQTAPDGSTPSAGDVKSPVDAIVPGDGPLKDDILSTPSPGKAKGKKDDNGSSAPTSPPTDGNTPSLPIGGYDELPKGIQKKLDRGGTLPSGIKKKLPDPNATTVPDPTAGAGAGTP